MLAEHESHAAEFTLMTISVVLAASGIYAAWRWYVQHTDVPDRIAGKFARTYRILLNKYYVDEAYDAVVVRPTQTASDKFLWKGVDVIIIDGAVNGTAKVIAIAAQTVRRVQTGVAQSYAMVIVAGIVAVIDRSSRPTAASAERTRSTNRAKRPGSTAETKSSS